MTRLRVFNNTHFPTVYTQSYTISGVPQSWAVPLTFYTDDYHYMEDVVVKDFVARRAKGEVFCNEMLQVRKTGIIVPSLIHNEGICSSNIRHVGHLLQAPPVGSLPPTESEQVRIWLDDEFDFERNAAINSSWSSVDESELNSLASLGELPETIEWFVSIFQRAIALLNVFRRKQLRKQVTKFLRSGDAVNVASDFWLELRYAVRPLLFEAEAAVNALNKALDRNSRRTARGFYGSRQPEVHDSTLYVAVSSDWGLNYAVKTSSLHNFRAGVLYSLAENVRPLSEVWGVNQPLEAVWELVPFSFIMDWFFNIGDVISSFSVSASLNSLTSWVTEEHVWSYEYTCTSIRQINTLCTYNLVYELETPGYSKGMLFVKRRIPTPSRSIIPTLRIKLDPAKILDLAAIGRSLLLGMRNRR